MKKFIIAIISSLVVFGGIILFNYYRGDLPRSSRNIDEIITINTHELIGINVTPGKNYEWKIAEQNGRVYEWIFFINGDFNHPYRMPSMANAKSGNNVQKLHAMLAPGQEVQVAQIHYREW